MAQPSMLDQLKSALDGGLIDQATFDLAAAALVAQPGGAGAVAHGQDALAVGAGGVAVKGDNTGVINLGVLIQRGQRHGASAQDLTRAYLARVLTQSDQLPLFAGDGGNEGLRLSSVYTALMAVGRRGPYGFKFMWEPALNALDAEDKLVLLGGPGSGKSTFVNFVALSMAGELLGTTPNIATLTAPLPAQEGEKNEPRPQHWRHGALLPVHITLRDLASQLPPSGAKVGAETIWNFICAQLKQQLLENFAPALSDHLHAHGGLILLDGLDEVPDADQRRDQIKQAVQQFAATFSRCRFLVTSRTYAYQRQDWKLTDFAEVELRPFSLAQINGFVDEWYAHMVALLRLTEANARARAETLKREVAHNPRIRELAERPLLLTLISKLQTDGGGNLPEKREELYDETVKMLLNKWESSKIVECEDGSEQLQPSLAEWLSASRDDIRKALDRLAFEAHRDQPKLEGTADIRQADLIAALLRASARPDVKVVRLEEYLRDRAGLLAAHGVGMYQFPHRSFQEYLAACHLSNDDFPDQLATLARADPNRWREVVLLAAAKAARGSALPTWALAETLCDAPPTDGAPAADHWGALLAGQVLVECADLARVAPRDAAKLARVRDWQLAIMRQAELPAIERALAGRSLAALGDTRAEVTTLAGMQFCLVAPGRFRMGSDGDDNAKPQHPVEVDTPYFIGRFPLTVAQWREYVQASGDTPGDEMSLKGEDNDPVICVSWHEALRCCEFLTAQWQAVLPPGFVATLPSEAEWEMAARGGEQLPPVPAPVTGADLRDALTSLAGVQGMANPLPARAYPWGEGFEPERANAEGSVGSVSAVGCFAAGASPYGCEEISGNVWEWTRSLWRPDFSEHEFGYLYSMRDHRCEALHAGNDVFRLVRGGSWNDIAWYARCANRSRDPPDFRNLNLGFRVVLRVAPVS